MPEFSRDAIRRIIAAVKDVERGRNMGDTKRRRHVVRSGNSCITDSPTTITGGVLSPDTTGWDRDTADEGFVMRVITDIRINVDELKMTYRDMTYDSCGRVSIVSAESSYTISDIEDCP